MTRLLTFAAFALPPFLARGEGYLCVVDMAAGFSSTNRGWQPSPLKNDDKILVRRAGQEDRVYLGTLTAPNGVKARWVVVMVGDKFPFAECADDLDSATVLFCYSYYGEFRMNKNSLRFLTAYLNGYWNSAPGKEAGDTPMVAIGKCSPM